MRGRTSEPELEKANFAKADEALAEVRSATVIHGYMARLLQHHTSKMMALSLHNGLITLSLPSMASRVHGMMPTSSVQQHSQSEKKAVSVSKSMHLYSVPESRGNVSTVPGGQEQVHLQCTCEGVL